MNPNNLTQEQIKQGYSTIEGAFDPLTGKLKPSNVITPQSLQPQTPIQLPQTPEITTPQQPIVNMANPFLEELKLNEQEQKAQQFQTAGIDQLIRDTIALESEGQSRAEEFAKAGVSTLKQDLQGINSQILKKQAEVQQDDITLVANMRAEERRDTLLPFAEMGKAKLAGDAMIVRALKNAEIGVLNATALAKQGDIALAIQTAEEAVATKYTPYKTRIERYDTIIKALDPYLSSAEKKEAQKQQFKGQMAMKEIEKVEENEKAIENMLIQAQVNQAPNSVLAKAQELAKKGASRVDIAKSLGQYSLSVADRLDIRLKETQINKLNQEMSQLKKVVPDAGDLVKINGKDYIRYKDGTISEPVVPEAGDRGMVVTRLDEKLKTVGKLTKPSVGLSTSAGSLRGAPIPFLYKNAINDWRADAVNIIQKLTVDELGRVKSDGVTFGALSNGERQAVGEAATALGAASIKDKEGNPTGRFKMSEKKVRDEFQKIYDGYALDFERRAGVPYETYQQNPEALKVQAVDDFIDTTGTALQANYGNYPTN